MVLGMVPVSELKAMLISLSEPQQEPQPIQREHR
jgi:hypothetical protein